MLKQLFLGVSWAKTAISCRIGSLGSVLTLGVHVRIELYLFRGFSYANLLACYDFLEFRQISTILRTRCMNFEIFQNGRRKLVDITFIKHFKAFIMVFVGSYGLC